MKEIIPAILTTDQIDLENKIRQVDGASHWIQIDICDGFFAPNKTILPSQIMTLDKKYSRIEIHLMVSDPLLYIDRCHELGADKIIFQLEPVVDQAENIINKIKQLGMLVGVAIKAETPPQTIEKFLFYGIDTILLLAVPAGAQGQTFDERILDKIKFIKDIHSRVGIEVDGGINDQNLTTILNSGADSLAVGSTIFSTIDPQKTIKNLAKIANQ